MLCASMKTLPTNASHEADLHMTHPTGLQQCCCQGHSTVHNSAEGGFVVCNSVQHARAQSQATQAITHGCVLHWQWQNPGKTMPLYHHKNATPRACTFPAYPLSQPCRLSLKLQVWTYWGCCGRLTVYLKQINVRQLWHPQ